MMDRIRKKDKKGFTLLEVLVGMLILSMGLLMLMPMMMVSMNANDFARGFTEASMLIKEKMEEIKNIENPSSGADTVDNATRTWTVTDAGAKLKRVLVNIQWVDQDGRDHTNSMVSYMMVD